MRLRLLALASGLAVVGATPCLALTISSAPPSRDVAPHLAQPANAATPSRDAWGGGRPQTGMNFGGAAVTYGESNFGFGSIRATPNGFRDVRGNERRDTPAPLSLSPPRR
jgi:hypothetical protein